MPSKRDPFPMASEAAKAMEESVSGAEGATASWNSMSITQQVQANSTKDDENDDARKPDSTTISSAGNSKLLPSSSKKKNKNDDDNDIYESLETDAAAQEKRHAEDDFLDRPAWESRATGWQRVCVHAKRFWLESVYRRLYGDALPVTEFVRVLTLALTLFFMIGGYWLMRSLKDPVLTALCGVTVIPKAKMLSVFIVLVVVSIYNRLLDSSIPKHQLFYLFGSFYSVLFSVIALLLMHPTIGLPNQQPSPWRILGWISYCSIESFGSVMVSLFWSFANSNIDLQTAKASYGVMVATAQVGSILGPTFVNVAAPVIGPAKCYLVGALCMLLLQGTMYLYISKYGAASTSSDNKSSNKPKAGIKEGLVLFYKHSYVKGIFAISCLFMVEVTIVDFTMKMLAQKYFAEEYPCQVGMSCYNAVAPGVHGSSEEATNAFTAFMGFFGQATNILSFLLSLLGTSAVIRHLGLRLTLLLFPILCLTVIVVVRLRPTLYVVFGAMMTLKACSYALNNPTKEILYQPTSSAVRYKAKSWIDIFGARGSKALGSLVTNAFSDSVTNLVANGSLVGMAVASFLIWNATFMGRKFDEYTAEGYIVGGDDDDDENGSNLRTAIGQNDNAETSCGIYDDDEVGPDEEGQSDDSNNNDEDDEEEEEDDDDADEEVGDFAKKPQVNLV